MTILVIDDSPEHLEILQDILENEGYKTVTALNAYDGLCILEKVKVHCIILDIAMPVLSGTDLLPVLKEKCPSVPVIVVTGSSESDSLILEKGAFAVFRKPANIDLLVRSLEDAIHDAACAITFVFNHTNLKTITSNIISRMLVLALRKTQGNQVKAAKLLGISRQGLIRYIKKFNLTGMCSQSPNV